MHLSLRENGLREKAKTCYRDSHYCVMENLMSRLLLLSLLSLTLSGLAADIHAVRAADPRQISNGLRIPCERYVDQPYVVVASNGTWICTLTTGSGLEGQPGQHIVATRSTDQGKTWTVLVDIEPADGPEASWATPLITPYGRIYVFYTYNGDNIVTLPDSNRRIRSDTQGWYAFRYSDDEGQTWSAQRYRIPLRITDVDRGNPWHGETCHFWGIDKPKVVNGTVFFAFTKLGKYFMQEGEGWLMRSDNLLTEHDPDKIHFTMLPEGNQGIRNPELGSVQEEHNLVPLGGSNLFCVFRLEGRTPAQSYSRDAGATWSLPTPMTYGPDQRTIKTPRACPKVFVTSEGKYLFWYHHHGGMNWRGRNPVFITGGLLKEDNHIHWSEPELLLFDPNPSIRMSYPDLIEQNGEFWVTETQKSVSRVHSVDRSLLEGLWNQKTANQVCQKGLVLEKLNSGDSSARPLAPNTFGLLSHGGLTLDLWVDLDPKLSSGELLISTLNAAGQGIRIMTTDLANQPTLLIELHDGNRVAAWYVDPGVVTRGAKHHVVFICDFSAAILSVVADGLFCDGGVARSCGWGRLPLDLDEVKGAPHVLMTSQVKHLRLYDRPLRTSEAVANFRSGMPQTQAQ